MATPGQGWIDPHFGSDGDFATAEQRLVAIYIFCHKDAAGVLSWDIPAVRAWTKLPKAKIIEAIAHFEEIGKVRFSRCRLWIWWRGGIKYYLHKGNFSPTQMQAVVLRLKAWQTAGVFGHGFARRVVDTYQGLYEITIPYPFGESDSNGSDPNQLKLELVKDE